MTAGELIKLLERYAPETEVGVRQLPTLTERYVYDVRLGSQLFTQTDDNGDFIEGEWYSVLWLEPAGR